MSVFTTKSDVIDEIVTCIEAGGAARADQFDLDRIVDTAYEYSAGRGGYVPSTDTDGFWAAVQAAELHPDAE